MPMRIQDLACSQAEERLQAFLKYNEASVNIAVGSVHIDVRLVNLKKFIEENCIVGLCFGGEGWRIDTQTFPNGCEGQL